MQSRTAFVLLVLNLFTSLGFAKRTDDVVVMKNGDRMTGEIQKLEQGKLYFKANYMLDTVQLDWSLVERLESKDLFNVSLTDGRIYTGLIERKPPTGESVEDFAILRDTSVITARRKDVVVVTPVEDNFWKQLTGSVDYGFSFTSGSQATQSSLSTEIAYRAERWSFQASGTSVFNAQSGSPNSGRNTLNLFYAKNLTARWFAGVVVDLLNSQQQDLSLRTLAGGGLGRVVVRTDRTTFGMLLGLDYSREHYSPQTGRNPQANNAEALLQFRYTMNRFKKTQIIAQASGYPSLTAIGRIRSGAESALKFEIFRNLYWKFSLYENFDSRPPVHAPRNDFGTSTSLGWTF